MAKIDEERQLPKRRQRRLVIPFDTDRTKETANIDAARPFVCHNQRLLTTPLPIRHQFRASFFDPVSEETRRSVPKSPANDLTVFEREQDFEALTIGVKVRRRMSAPIHLDDDAEEDRARRYRRRLNCPKSSSASGSGSGA